MIMKIKLMKKNASCLIAEIFKKSAVKSANSTCDWWSYQRVLPEEVKKLRKIK